MDNTETTTTDFFKLVGDFHKAFDVHEMEFNTPPPKELIELRLKLLREELTETVHALEQQNGIEVLDGLADIMFVLVGTIRTFGMERVFGEVFEEVSRSNMSKLGSNGRPLLREDGKVIKGPAYFKPNISKIVKKHIADIEENKRQQKLNLKK